MVASHLSGGVGAAGVALDGVRASALAVATTVNTKRGTRGRERNPGSGQKPLVDWSGVSRIDQACSARNSATLRQIVFDASSLRGALSTPPHFPRAPTESRRIYAASPRPTRVQRPAAPRHVRRLRPPLRDRPPPRARRFDARVQEGHRCRAPARAPRATRLRGERHRACRRYHREGHQGRARDGHAGTCGAMPYPLGLATRQPAIYPKPRSKAKKSALSERRRRARARRDAIASDDARYPFVPFPVSRRRVTALSCIARIVGPVDASGD